MISIEAAIYPSGTRYFRVKYHDLVLGCFDETPDGFKVDYTTYSRPPDAIDAVISKFIRRTRNQIKALELEVENVRAMQKLTRKRAKEE